MSRYGRRSYYYDDTNYDQKVPKNYNDILAKAVNPVTHSSKKELYNKLCQSIPIEGGTKILWLDGSTDKIAIMVSAKALDIIEGFDSRCWQWVSTQDSRFGLAAEVKKVEWFEVWQCIDCTLLTPETEYSVSFVLKIEKNSMPTCPSPFTFSLLTMDGKLIEKAIYLDDHQKSVTKDKPNIINAEKGWTEFVVGDFVTKESCDSMEIDVCMKNTDCNFIKRGIVIDGVKIKPK
ncbi:hypothetical protein SUGI_0723420 [Cryptomeria japonica]|uniref:F-box protein PP2-A15 n=1 Tax=Cryptomeria japonica TaxID=3369 RepID=UPI002414CA41|nr:F-box protein PP2-A15 [Cryptomeria japonica]GLJ36054.1 hypothetical protein SUGI_0723420 [Cryptomeria japonica]